MDSEDLPAKTCRTCLLTESITISLHDLNDVLMKKLISIYPKLLIDIPSQSPEAASVKFICENCLILLETSYAFHLKVEESERILWGKLEKQIKTELQCKPEPELVTITNPLAITVPTDNPSDDEFNFETMPVKTEIKLEDYECFEQDEFKTIDPIQAYQNQSKKIYPCPGFPCNYSSEMGYDMTRHINCKHLEYVKNFTTVPLAEQQFHSETHAFVLSLVENNRQSNSVREILQCSNCHQTFENNYNFKRHLQRKACSYSRGFPCEYCGQSFSSYTARETHVTNVHVAKLQNFLQENGVALQPISSETDFFTCDVCKKGFNSRPEQESRMMVHSNENFILCSICGIAFDKKILSDLKKHH